MIDDPSFNQNPLPKQCVHIAKHPRPLYKLSISAQHTTLSFSICIYLESPTIDRSVHLLTLIKHFAAKTNHHRRDCALDVISPSEVIAIKYASFFLLTWPVSHAPFPLVNIQITLHKWHRMRTKLPRIHCGVSFRHANATRCDAQRAPRRSAERGAPKSKLNYYRS